MDTNLVVTFQREHYLLVVQLQVHVEQLEEVDYKNNLKVDQWQQVGHSYYMTAII